MPAERVWVTVEKEPRLLVQKGKSAIDPDIIVARPFGSDEPLWIMEHSGYVCDWGVTAKRTSINAKNAAALLRSLEGEQ